MRRALSLAVATLTIVVFAAGCSQQMRAERDGRDLAEAVCDLRNADDGESSAAEIERIVNSIDNLERRYGLATAEDRADIKRNLDDLAEHALAGNELLIQQDLAVLERSAENIRSDAGDVNDAAWNGFTDGVRECIEG